MYIDIVCLYNPYDIYFVLLGVIKVATRLNYNLEVVYSGRIDQGKSKFRSVVSYQN